MSPQVPIWAVSKTLKTTTHKTLCRLGPEPQSNTMVISKFLRYFKIRIVRVTLLPKDELKYWLNSPIAIYESLGKQTDTWSRCPNPPTPQPTHPHYQVPTEDHRIRKHSTVEAFFSHTLFFCKLYNNEELSILLFSIFCQFVVRSWILAGDQQLFSSGETFVLGVIRIQSIRLLAIVIQTRPDPTVFRWQRHISKLDW